MTFLTTKVDNPIEVALDIVMGLVNTNACFEGMREKLRTKVMVSTCSYSEVHINTVLSIYLKLIEEEYKNSVNNTNIVFESVEAK